jgi:hypothetical protein
MVLLSWRIARPQEQPYDKLTLEQYCSGCGRQSRVEGPHQSEQLTHLKHAWDALNVHMGGLQKDVKDACENWRVDELVNHDLRCHCKQHSFAIDHTEHFKHQRAAMEPSTSPSAGCVGRSLDKEITALRILTKA